MRPASCCSNTCIAWKVFCFDTAVYALQPCDPTMHVCCRASARAWLSALPMLSRYAADAIQRMPNEWPGATQPRLRVACCRCLCLAVSAARCGQPCSCCSLLHHSALPAEVRARIPCTTRPRRPARRTPMFALVGTQHRSSALCVPAGARARLSVLPDAERRAAAADLALKLSSMMGLGADSDSGSEDVTAADDRQP